MRGGTPEPLIGRRFGRLLVVALDRRGPPHPYWRCSCDCGRSVVVQAGSLKSGKTRSCGCLQRDTVSASARVRNTTHGRSRANGRVTDEYKAWQAMIARCENPRTDSYPIYGGRGISVCERWRRDFAAFLADMGERPSPSHSIDRIDPNGNYEPSNCRWATKKQQARNKRSTRILSTGETLPAAAERTGIPYAVLWSRLQDMPEDLALTIPYRGYKKRPKATPDDAPPSPGLFED